MFTKIDKSQGTSNFQTVTKSRFDQTITPSTFNNSIFVRKTGRTVTPNESDFININNRRKYHYNEKK